MSLQYSTLPHHDIALAINKVCQFVQSPTVDDWTAVKSILSYLKHPHLCLKCILQCGVRKIAALPVDCLYIRPGLISWSFQKHNADSRSSTELEYCEWTTARAQATYLPKKKKKQHK